jgi:hypothetical protein
MVHLAASTAGQRESQLGSVAASYFVEPPPVGPPSETVPPDPSLLHAATKSTASPENREKVFAIGQG